VPALKGEGIQQISPTQTLGRKNFSGVLGKKENNVPIEKAKGGRRSGASAQWL